MRGRQGVQMGSEGRGCRWDLRVTRDGALRHAVDTARCIIVLLNNSRSETGSYITMYLYYVPLYRLQDFRRAFQERPLKIVNIGKGGSDGRAVRLWAAGWLQGAIILRGR